MNYISLFFLNFLNFHDDYLLICYWFLIPRNNQSIELFVLFGLYIYISIIHIKWKLQLIVFPEKSCYKM